MADVAHELRTPLTAMQGRPEGMIDGVYPADAAPVMQVLEDTRVLGRLVEDLRTLALQREPTDLANLVANAVRFTPRGGDVRLDVTRPRPASR